MNTDCLTPMAYSIIVEADPIMDVLRTEIGASCEKCDTEDAFLHETLKSIERIIRDPESYLDKWNCLDETDPEQFKTSLEILRKFVVIVIDTPLSERADPPFQ